MWWTRWGSSHRITPSDLPFPQSRGNTSQTTNVRFWVMFAMFPGDGWYQIFLFLLCQHCRFCCVIVERSKKKKSPFAWFVENILFYIPLFRAISSHWVDTIQGINDTGLSGWELCHGVMTSYCGGKFWVEIVKAGILPSDLWSTYLATSEGMCSRKCNGKMVEILLVWLLWNAFSFLLYPAFHQHSALWK